MLYLMFCRFGVGHPKVHSPVALLEITRQHFCKRVFFRKKNDAPNTDRAVTLSCEPGYDIRCIKQPGMRMCLESGIPGMEQPYMRCLIRIGRSRHETTKKSMVRRICKTARCMTLLPRTRTAQIR